MASEPQVVKTPTDARQAQHAGVRNVLIWGLILVVAAFGIVYLVMK